MSAVAQLGDLSGCYLLAEFKVKHQDVRVTSWASQDCVHGIGHRHDLCSPARISIDPGTHAFGNDVELF
jgi:hypothetical protein